MGRRHGVSWRVKRRALGQMGRGMTSAEVGAEAGVSGSAVRMWVAEHGVMSSYEPRARDGELSLDERIEIQVGLRRGDKPPAIARGLGRHRSTVWREVRRNVGEDGDVADYRAAAAQERAEQEARRPRQWWWQEQPELWAVVCERLIDHLWSPEQISAWLRIEHPDDQTWWVSHESIYGAIYVQTRGELKRRLIAALRHNKPQRGRRRSGAGNGPVSDGVNISKRPAEAADRAVPGHWEGDLIMGAHNRSQIITLAERVTRYGLLIAVGDKTADAVARAVAAHLAHLPDQLARSLTWDRGSEMADHATVKINTGIDVYFCDPHSPWQRPTNENYNGLARGFLPKGTDLSVHSQDDLDVIADKLNQRPRKTLDWKTPAECYNQLLVATTA